mgnify:FL=1
MSRQSHLTPQQALIAYHLCNERHGYSPSMPCDECEAETTRKIAPPIGDTNTVTSPAKWDTAASRLARIIAKAPARPGKPTYGLIMEAERGGETDRLRAALRKLHSAVDSELMGDRDGPDDDSPLMLAMIEAARLAFPTAASQGDAKRGGGAEVDKEQATTLHADTREIEAAIRDLEYCAEDDRDKLPAARATLLTLYTARTLPR